jgi:hypothetical protein
MESNRRDFLMVSPFIEDEGELIGRDPRTLRLEERASGVSEFGWSASQGRAIRKFCLDCCGDNAAETRKCVAVGCPLWPHRMGSNVLHANAKVRRAVCGGPQTTGDD